MAIKVILVLSLWRNKIISQTFFFNPYSIRLLFIPCWLELGYLPILNEPLAKVNVVIKYDLHQGFSKGWLWTSSIGIPWELIREIQILGLHISTPETEIVGMGPTSLVQTIHLDKSDSFFRFENYWFRVITSSSSAGEKTHVPWTSCFLRKSGVFDSGCR